MISGLRRSMYRSINRVLYSMGMQLTPVGIDFAARPLTEAVQKALFRELALCADQWFASQSLFKPAAFDTEALVRDFYFAYLASPFREQSGGSRFNNSLWLALLARAFDPKVIIDSGTYRGVSAWALSFGAPAAELLSFDIDLSHISKRVPGVRYFEHDWTKHNLGKDDGSRTLCYFDDHVDQVRRLLEAHERGIALAVFDDDFPVVPALPFAHEGMSFPKIEFALDDTLLGEKEISWDLKGRKLSWPIDHAYLQRARVAIAATDRVSNSSAITGIWQTPYRVVALAPRAVP